MTKRLSHQSGFTLVELAVVIAIVATLVTVGASMGQDAISFSKRYVTQKRLVSVEEALDAFVDKYGFLPCPADLTLQPGTSSAFGEQNCTATGTGIVEVTDANGDVLMGALPVRALQLPDNYASDAWNSKLLYAVSEDMAIDSASSVQHGTLYINNDGNINIRAGNSAGTNFSLTTTTDAASYVVVSFGENRAGAYPYRDNAVEISCIGSFAEGDNCDMADRVFYDNFYNDGETSSYFDDFVIWGSKL